MRSMFLLLIPLATTALGLLLLFTPIYTNLENEFYDMGFSFRMKAPSVDTLAVAVIDDQALKLRNNKPWPWERQLIGEILDAIKQLGARVIGVDIFFEQKQPLELNQAQFIKYYMELNRMGKTFDQLFHTHASHQELSRHWANLYDTLRSMSQPDHLASFYINQDEYLARHIQASESIVLATYVDDIDAFRLNHDPSILTHTLPASDHQKPSSHIYALNPPVYPLGKYVAGLGHINIHSPGNIHTWDSIIRTVPLILPIQLDSGETRWSLGFALACFIAYYQIDPDSILIESNKSIHITSSSSKRDFPGIDIPISPPYSYYINWIPSNTSYNEGSNPSYGFPVFSVSEILAYLELKKDLAALRSRLDMPTPELHTTNPAALQSKINTMQINLNNLTHRLMEDLEDRLVLFGIGFTASQDDVGSSPVNKTIPKILTHANILHNLFTQQFLIRVGDGIAILITFLINILLSVIIMIVRKRALITSLIGAGFVVCYLFVMGVLFVYFDLYVGVLLGLVSLTATFLIFTIYSYIQTQRTNALLKAAKDEIEQQKYELEQAHQELTQAHVELKEKQAQLIQIQKMAAMGQILAGISHELNNPLNYIQGTIFPLRQNMRDLTALHDRFRNLWETHFDSVQAYQQELEAVRSFADEIELHTIQKEIEEITHNIEEGVNRSQAIITRLKNFTRKDTGDFEDENVHTILDNTLVMFKSQIADGITIQKEYHADPPIIHCSAVALGQVFTNLIVNALHAMHNLGTLTIKTYREDSFILIDVSDTGHGIDSALLDRIFDPYFTTKGVGEGTGIGLSISYDIIKQHQGVISVQSTMGKGTTFTIRLPA